jgi:hypothetical protein
MLRAVALSLLVLFSIATLLPLAHSSAQGEGGRSASTRRNKKRVRRHSRAWWRRYRAHLRRRKRAAAILARERSATALTASENNRDAAISPNALSSTGGIYNDPRGLFSLTMPGGWSSRSSVAKNEARFRIYAPDGRVAGQATLSVIPPIAPGDGALSMRERARALGGVPLANLRRTVIDKMVASNGWVVNDLEQEINGRRVFVVLAQTAASPDASVPQRFWTFHFTEVDGRIYSLATSMPLELSDRISNESAQVIASFRTRPVSTLAETSPR